MLHASDLVISLQLKVKESIEESFSYYAGDDGSVDAQVMQRYSEVLCCGCYTF